MSKISHRDTPNVTTPPNSYAPPGTLLRCQICPRSLLQSNSVSVSQLLLKRAFLVHLDKKYITGSKVSKCK